MREGAGASKQGMKREEKKGGTVYRTVDIEFIKKKLSL